MSLYPSLEDMKVAQLTKAQYDAEFAQNAAPSAPLPYPLYSTVQNSQNSMYPMSNPNQSSVYPTANIQSSVYPALGDFMGLELTSDVIAANMPEYAVATLQPREIAPVNNIGGMIAPLSSQSLGLQRAHVTHGIREVTVCKDADGKIGLRVQAVNSGIFISLVSKNSPASLVRLRFGDQILQINGENVAGYTMEKVHDILKKCPVDGIKIVVRDRPFERTVTLHKDSTGHVGFHFKNGKIVKLTVESSAARNGLLTDHHLLEVNGQNVVGVKDKDITSIIEEGGDIITVTIIPSFLYEHMTKRMANNLLTGLMDHSIPNI